MTDDAYVRVQGIDKSFGSFAALKNVDVSIGRGEFICLLGPSGCGKTTLLRVIAGFERQDAGRIVQNGTDISDFPVSKRDFGIVFQSYALFPNLTCAQNIAFGLQARKTPKRDRDRTVDDLLAQMHLSGSSAKYPAQLSGGQQQRVALARALALKPNLLLLDEPLSALDAQVRTRLRAELKDIQRRVGVTTIMVTHDQEEAIELADRIVLMEGGRVVQVGTPSELYEAPQTRFAAEFIGAMNFIDGEMVHANTVAVNGIEIATPQQGVTLSSGRVSIGIRPEDIRIGDGGSADENSFQATIDNITFAGARLYVDVTIPSFNTILKAEIKKPRGGRPEDARGSVVHVTLPKSDLKIFGR